MNFLTEVINLGVLGFIVPSPPTPSPRQFVFDYDFDEQNFIRVDVMSPQFVKTGTSTAESRNGLAVQGMNVNLTGDITVANMFHGSSVSSTGTTYTNFNITYFFTFDRVNNKIIVDLAVAGNPTIPTWSCLNFRTWTVI